MKTYSTSQKMKFLFSLPVIVAALGYFVDIYDLTLFGIVRVESLKSLGLDIDKVGSLILNLQMFGFSTLACRRASPVKNHLPRD